MQKLRRCCSPRSPTFLLEAHLTLNPFLGGERLIVFGCSLWLGWGAFRCGVFGLWGLGFGLGFSFVNCQRVGDLFMH